MREVACADWLTLRALSLSVVARPQSHDGPTDHLYRQILAEREAFEPETRSNKINNLLKCFEILSPPIPSNPRIWHSIWH